MSLVSTNWLEKNISKVKILDCSWHMPNTNRNGYEEYLENHIENAIFFDLDNNSKQNIDLPHMLPDYKDWEKIISNLGITNQDQIIIYDNSDVISSCRCWYSFIFFGHSPKLVSILDGGMNKWKLDGKKLTNKINQIVKKKYYAKPIYSLVKNKKQIDKNIYSNKFKLVDARSKNRFLGIEPEPRKGLESGSIKNSISLPFKKCIDLSDKTFLNRLSLKKIFNFVGINNEENIVFTCGSGVTAAVLSLAYSLINDKYSPIIYDGSWAEYGKIEDKKNEKIY